MMKSLIEYQELHHTFILRLKLMLRHRWLQLGLIPQLG